MRAEQGMQPIVNEKRTNIIQLNAICTIFFTTIVQEKRKVDSRILAATKHVTKSHFTSFLLLIQAFLPSQKEMFDDNFVLQKRREATRFSSYFKSFGKLAVFALSGRYSSRVEEINTQCIIHGP